MGCACKRWAARSPHPHTCCNNFRETRRRRRKRRRRRRERSGGKCNGLITTQCRGVEKYRLFKSSPSIILHTFLLFSFTLSCSLLWLGFSAVKKNRRIIEFIHLSTSQTLRAPRPSQTHLQVQLQQLASPPSVRLSWKNPLLLSPPPPPPWPSLYPVSPLYLHLLVLHVCRYLASLSFNG